MTLVTDVERLQTMSMFHNVDMARLKLVALMSERVQFARRNYVFRQGEMPDAVYIILSGEVEVSRSTDEGRLQAAVPEEAAFFGAGAMLCDEVSPYDVRARSDLVALRLSKELFFDLMQSVPEFSLAVARSLAARINEIATLSPGEPG